VGVGESRAVAEALSGIEVPSANQRVYELYKQFTSDVDHVTTQIAFVMRRAIDNLLYD
jgi:hypothetical protein